MRAGTLIRIVTPEGKSAYACTETDGTLWVVERNASGGNGVRAKSLATGRHYVWFKEEFETCPS